MRNGKFVMDAHTGFWDASPENCKNKYGEAFIETIPLAGGGERFGGTLAPTLRLQVDGASTYLVERLDYGFIPAMRDTG